QLHSMSDTEAGWVPPWNLDSGSFGGVRRDTGLINVSPGDSLHTEASFSLNISPGPGNIGPSSPNGVELTANASAWMTVPPGEFHLRLHADASDILAASRVQGSASVYGEWADDFTVHSNTLPGGTVVTLSFSTVI